MDFLIKIICVTPDVSKIHNQGPDSEGVENYRIVQGKDWKNDEVRTQWYIDDSGPSIFILRMSPTPLQ